MKKSLSVIKPLVLACSLALAACGGDDGGTTAPAVTTVTGVVTAPSGLVAQLAQDKTFLAAAIEFVFPGAIAGITGLEPVTGATVQLIRIDDDGAQVGAVLAETVTSITGNYSLSLPAGVSLAGNLIVRITGNGGASMSAMVVDQVVDINPISQYVLDKFVDDDNLVLADLAVNQVVALRGKVEEFDLTATADLSTMLAALEAEVGQFVDNEIAIIEMTPDDGTAVAAVAGKWHLVELGLELSDADAINYGTFAMSVISEELTFAASGNAAANLTISGGAVLIDAWTNFSNNNFLNWNLYHESSVTSDIDSFPALIDADGNISISFGFEEDLQTVDILQDPDGPDYGWRYPPGSEFLQPVMSGNMYITGFNEAGVRYNTIDTNADGVKDAIDPASKDGDEAGHSLAVVLKEGSGMSASDLSGNYGAVFLNLNVDNAMGPITVVDSTVGVLGFDGAGNIARAAGAFDVAKYTRNPVTPGLATLTDVTFTEPALADSFTYTMSATGLFSLDTGNGVLEGFTSSDGQLIALVDDSASGNPVDNVNDEMQMMVKLGTGVNAAKTTVLGGASYKLHLLGLNASTSGYSEVFTLRNGVLAFDAGVTTAVVTGVNHGVQRDTDVAQIAAIAADAVNETFTIDSVSADGEVIMSTTTTDASGMETIVLRGFVSEDKNLLVLRLYREFAGTSETDYDLGLVVGVRQ